VASMPCNTDGGASEARSVPSSLPVHSSPNDQACCRSARPLSRHFAVQCKCAVAYRYCGSATLVARVLSTAPLHAGHDRILSVKQIPRQIPRQIPILPPPNSRSDARRQPSKTCFAAEPLELSPATKAHDYMDGVTGLAARLPTLRSSVGRSLRSSSCLDIIHSPSELATLSPSIDRG
jgi:hypothetical protein